MRAEWAPPPFEVGGPVLEIAVDAMVVRSGVILPAVERSDVAVVGGGQAGLAVSHELSTRGIEHVVLERGRAGESWRGRWDSFCLVTPNWSVRLPGLHYDGDDPDGYMHRGELVAYFERLAVAVSAPLREGVDVGSVRRELDGFALGTSMGDVHADQLVVATGAYQQAYRPASADSLHEDVLQLDVGDYRNPEALPAGPVLIVGSGQSGCQIAEELHEAGREVFLSCGRAPWVPRRLGGRDIVWWGVETGFLDQPVEALPDPSFRLTANLLTTGHGGGHDLNLRTLQALGVTLLGRFVGAENGLAHFAGDLADSLAWGDERYLQFMDLCRRLVEDRRMEPLDIPEPRPFDARSPERLDVRALGAIVWAGGYRPNYAWLPWPEAFDPLGFPLQRDGTSTIVPGLHFVGVHFLRTRKSSLLIGVGEDAAIVAEGIAAGFGAV